LNIGLIIGIKGTAAAVIAAAFAIFPRLPHGRTNVRRITKETDPDLVAVLSMNSALSPNVSIPPQRIREWIAENRLETKTGAAKWREYFMVAKRAGLVCG